MRSWSITLSIIGASLINCTWVMRCGPGSSGTSIGSSSSDNDADLPECCRNGMCPHGHGPHKPTPQFPPSDTPTCSCAADSTAMMVLSAVPVVHSPDTLSAIDLEPVESVSLMFTPNVIDRDRPPSTPPPKV